MKPTAEEFFREKIREQSNSTKDITLSTVVITAEQGMRWAYEYATITQKEVRKIDEDKWISENCEQVLDFKGEKYYLKRDNTCGVFNRTQLRNLFKNEFYPVSQKEKPLNRLYESQMKTILGRYTKEQISFGKMVELINEIIAIPNDKIVMTDWDIVMDKYKEEYPNFHKHLEDWLNKNSK